MDAVSGALAPLSSRGAFAADLFRSCRTFPPRLVECMGQDNEWHSLGAPGEGDAPTQSLWARLRFLP